MMMARKAGSMTTGAGGTCGVRKRFGMLKRCVYLLVGAAVLGAAIELVHPSAFWQLRGWATGEPFWEDLPASYWRREISKFTVTVRESNPKERVRVQSRYSFQITGVSPGPIDRFEIWLYDMTGRQVFGARKSCLDLSSDPGALPVVLALATDHDPRIRAWAVIRLSALAQGFPETKTAASVALRGALNDEGELAGQWPSVTVGQLASDCASELCNEIQPAK
jgi:hypothetical protein